MPRASAATSKSLSAYARQFLEMMQKPDVDQIDGLSPAISIEQKTTSRNPRSTVGTVTEIYDYMRLLWARVGVPYSPATGLPIESQTVSQMVDRVMALPEGTRLYLLAPVVRGRKGEYRKELAEYLKKGYQRVKIDGKFYEIADVPALDKKFNHDIDVVVDRIVVRADIATRLADSLEKALKLADGLAVVELADGRARPQAPRPTSSRNETAERLIFSEKFACPVSGFTIPEIEPRLFSFNNPFGACPKCGGLGVEQHIDADLVIPDKDATLRKGAIAPWAKSSRPITCRRWKRSASTTSSRSTPNGRTCRRRRRTRSSTAPARTTSVHLRRRHALLPDQEAVRGRDHQSRAPLARRPRATGRARRWQKYFTDMPCDACNGYRLKPEALCVKVGGLHIGEVAEMSVEARRRMVHRAAEAAHRQAERDRGRACSRKSASGCKFLVDVGLEYLTLARASGTLSGGESQRIRLASQIGSGLTGVLYVLDEPSIGLHQRDNARLLETLQAPARPRQHRDRGRARRGRHPHRRPRARHRPRRRHPRRRDHRAGHGRRHHRPRRTRSPANISPASWSSPMPERRPTNARRALKVVNARGNNLKNVTAEIPLGLFTCVTGVSGGGKSTLLVDTLYKAVARKLNGASEAPAPHDRIEGLEHLDKVIDIDQSPIGRTPRSNPATYTGAFTPIREWFAGLPEAKARGYEPGRFSFNVKGGRCEACQGDGVIKIEMHFLPDVYVTCDVCKGKRYNRETLEVTVQGQVDRRRARHDGRGGAGVLQGGAARAQRARAAAPRRPRLHPCRPAGDHAVRRRGAARQARQGAVASAPPAARSTSSTSRPPGCTSTTSRSCSRCCTSWSSSGNTVVVIEHNLEVIKTADWIIDLGPEGGDGGGEIVAAGTPEEMVKVKRSYTGQFLTPVLARREAKAQGEDRGGGVKFGNFVPLSIRPGRAEIELARPLLVPLPWSRRVSHPRQRPLRLRVDGTFTSASPSSTTSSATVQVQVSRARWRSGHEFRHCHGDVDLVADPHRRAEIERLRDVDRAGPGQPRAQHGRDQARGVEPVGDALAELASWRRNAPTDGSDCGRR